MAPQPSQHYHTGNIDAPLGGFTYERVEGSRIRKGWDDLSPRFARSRQRYMDALDLQSGRAIAKMPSTWDDEAAADHIVILPHRKLLPLRQSSVLADKRPLIERLAMRDSDGSQNQADAIEAFLNAYMEPALNWRRMIGKAVQLSEYLVLVQADTTNWRATPTYLDSLTRTDYDAYLGSDKGSYKWDAAIDRYVKADAKGRSLPKERYWRDGKKRNADHPEFSGTVHEKNSAAAHDKELDEHYAANPPVRVRIVSPQNYLPVYGDDDKLEGVFIRTLYDRNELIRRKYRWGTRPGGQGPLMMPASDFSDNGYGTGSQVYLYEYHGTDENGDPYISYSCGGMESAWIDDQGHEDPCTIDLRKEYGQRRMFAMVGWGQASEDDDPDERGVPFLDPLKTAIKNVEILASNALVYSRRTAFPPLGMTPNPGAPEEAYLESDGSMKKVDLPSGGGIVTLSGDPKPLMPGRMGDEVLPLLEFLMKTMEDSTPDESQYGGPGAVSGHQLSLSRDYLIVANGQILMGAKEAYKFAASSVLELCCCLERKFGVAIKVYRNVEPTLEELETGTARRRREVLTLKERWVGTLYDVDCKYPVDANLAEMQQKADLADRGYATFNEVREAQGDQTPNKTRAEITNDQFWKTPEGMKILWERAAKLRNDKMLLDQLQLQQQGEMSPGGMPTAAMGGAAGSPAQLPNIAGSAMAGAISGQMDTGPQVQDATARANAGTANPGGMPA